MRNEKGQFIKGHIKPKIMLQKISNSLKGNKCHLGFKHSKEARKRMSEAHKGKSRPWRKGKKYPAISNALKGRKLSEDHIRNMSKALQGRKAWNKGTRGICKSNSGSLKKGERQKLISIMGNKKQLEMKGPTSIEKKVYDELKRRGILFEQQKLIKGKFIVDAYIPSLNLIIEADGDYWHSLPRTIINDKYKNVCLKDWGFKLLRLSESEINKDVKSCIDKIN